MRTRSVRLLAALLLTGTVCSGYVLHRHTATAARPTVTFVTDIGGLNDNGFNHLGYVGTVTGATKAGWAYKVIETQSSSDYVKNLTTAAQQGQFVAAVGFSFGTALKEVAAKFPKVKFTIIDWNYTPSPQNVLGNIFMPNESSYLAGILAAGVSKSHVIGFVGGVKGPVIAVFEAGFRAGAKAYDPSVRVISIYTNSFTDQSAGKAAGLQEINAGADVVYAAAGASGLGTLTAADQRGVYSIGVDADQNYLHPHSVISSVVKHVEVAVASAIESAAAGTFHSGTKLWNLANNGVGLAPFHSLASKVPAKVKAAIAKAKADIISGKIKVPSTL